MKSQNFYLRVFSVKEKRRPTAPNSWRTVEETEFVKQRISAGHPDRERKWEVRADLDAASGGIRASFFYEVDDPRGLPVTDSIVHVTIDDETPPTVEQAKE